MPILTDIFDTAHTPFDSAAWNRNCDNGQRRADGGLLVDGDLHGHLLMQSGSLVINPGGGGSTDERTVSVTFGRPFHQIPGITLTYDANEGNGSEDQLVNEYDVAIVPGYLYTLAPNPLGFQIVIRPYSDAEMTVNWLAIGV